jgi:hypothetical protein
VTPDWLRDSVAQDSLLPCADYVALPDLKEVDGKLSPRTISQSRVISLRSSPSTCSRPPSRAAHTVTSPPPFLLHPSVPPPKVELDHTAHFCCARASPLVCINQPLCAALDVLRRSRVLESNERSALSYGRAIAVSMSSLSFYLFCSQLVYSVDYQRYSRIHLMLSTHPLTGLWSSAFPRKIAAKERGEVQKLPFIGAKVSKMVGCTRSSYTHPFTHIKQIDEYLFHGYIPEVGMCYVFPTPHT